MLRDNLAGLIEPMLSSAGACPLALCTDRNGSSDDRPQNALKIPARQGGIYALTENVPSPFHAELGQVRHVRMQGDERWHYRTQSNIGFARGEFPRQQFVRVRSLDIQVEM